MQPSDNQILESYVPVYDVVPEKWEDARPFIVEQLKRIATAVNIREIGWFLDEELLSGKAFIPGVNASGTGATSQLYRQILRKVINFGALPNTTVKVVPHGITVDANFTLIQMYAATSDPVSLVSLPIPYLDTSGPTSFIGMNMDATNVNIATGSNRSNFTRCYVVIEYIQEL